MSKCDFWIEFDRANRTYRTGELVRGKLAVSVNKTVECRDLKLTGLWRTHGRGNQARGDYYNKSLFQGKLNEGERHEFEFEFQIPPTPTTYHGTLINVDHYVTARVDVPWAFDAVGEADFVVLQGDSPQDTEAPLATFAPSTSKIGVFIGSSVAAVLILAGLVFIPVFGIGLLMIAAGAVILFFTFRNVLAERKLGPVECVVAPTQQVPGGELGIRVSMTPRKSVSITQIKITFAGHEIAVSGSGTNKTTHRHQLHSETSVIASNLTLQPGVNHTTEYFLTCPETNAYSFALGENRVAWSIQVHLDIPRWPDWVQSVNVYLIPPVADRPATQNDAASKDPASPSPRIETILETPFAAVPEPNAANRSIETSTDPTVQLVYDELETGALETNDAFVPQSSTLASLISIASSLRAADRYGSQRTKIVENHNSEVFEVEITVDRFAPTFGVYDAAEYRSGMTVIGKLGSTDLPVAVQFPETRNDDVKSLTQGAPWRGLAILHRWDDLYDRLELRVP